MTGSKSPPFSDTNPDKTVGLEHQKIFGGEFNMMNKSVGYGARLPRFENWLCHFLAAWPVSSCVQWG